MDALGKLEIIHLARRVPAWSTVLLVNVLAIILTFAIEPIVGPDPYPLCVAAVAISVNYGGIAGGIFSILFATLATDLFFIPPFLSVSLSQDLPEFGLYFIVALIVGSIISRRKHVEESLHQLSSALEQTADNVFITDRAGRIEYVNPAFTSLTGYTRAEAIGATARILKSDRHDHDFYARLWEIILAGKTFRGQVVNRKKNGELYYEEKTITPLRDPEGHITHFVSTGKDITERVQAYQTLERRVEERTSETRALYAQAEQHGRELEALYRADEQLYRHLRLGQVLQALVDVVIDILHADKANVQVWDALDRRLTVRAARGYSDESLALLSKDVPGEGVAGTVFTTHELLAIEDARKAPPPGHRVADKEGIRSVLSVPITIAGEVFGAFTMAYGTPRVFGADDRRLFLALAQRAAMAIENARLYEQAEQVATLEERQRLARELHDSVTQSLCSLSLLTEAARRQVAAGEVIRAEAHLTRLGETTQQSLKEMRLLVYELRPPALEEEGLVGALQQRLDAVEKRAGIEAKLEADRLLSLPPAVEAALYRIAQEALNNALKHAGAKKVTVKLRVQDHIELQVFDNGKGFDPLLADDKGGLGLISMRQRAERLGGWLEIRSTPGEGTCVSVRFTNSRVAEAVA